MTLCAHDMDPGTCADCSPAARPRPVPPGWGLWFTAAYNGTCAGCGDGIFPGDTIRADGDGGYLCEPCGSAAGGFAP